MNFSMAILRNMYEIFHKKLSDFLDNLFMKFNTFYTGIIHYISKLSLIVFCIVLILDIVAFIQSYFSDSHFTVETILSQFYQTFFFGKYFLIFYGIDIAVNKWKESISNNQFNNYFKHKEEFIKEFSKHELIKELKKLTETDTASVLRDMYILFYYKSDKEFSFRMNKKAHSDIKRFLKRFEKSELNKSNTSLYDLPIEKLEHLSKINIADVRRYITSINSRLTPAMRKRWGNISMNDKLDFKKIVYINEIYFSALLYNNLLQYDGNISVNINNFLANIVDYKLFTNYDEARLDIINEKRYG